jgi:hypothetical protein
VYYIVTLLVNAMTILTMLVFRLPFYRWSYRWTLQARRVTSSWTVEAQW